MNKVLLALVVPALLLADFRYDQTTRVTKGAMLKMPFVKKPEPTTSTTYFKGGRMATASKDSTTIIDFDKQLLTTINHQKSEYWQMTFAEMQQMMSDAMAQVNTSSKPQNASAEMKFEAKSTGVEKDVNGYVAQQVLLTMEMVAKDGKQNQSMPAMKIISDSWHSEKVPGYGEYKKFLAQMQGRENWMRGNPFAGMMNQPGMAEGMKKMAEEMMKVPGIPVLTITRVVMPGMPNMDFSQANGGAGGPSEADVADAAKRAGGEAAGGAAGRAVGGRLGGMIGGGLGGRLGGFGRKKQDESAQAEAAKTAEQQAKENAAGQQQGDKGGDGVFMETLTDTSNFSGAPIGEEVFSIPSGYTRNQPDFGKRKR